MFITIGYDFITYECHPSIPNRTVRDGVLVNVVAKKHPVL